MAVVTEDGKVQLNKNVVNSSEPFLRLIGDLPAGTPVASGAVFGWGWLADLLEDYGFEAHLVHPLRCKAIASARLKNDKGRRGDPGAAAARPPAAQAWIAPANVRADGVGLYQMIGVRHGQSACMRRIVVSRWQLITPSSRRVCGGVFSSGVCIGFRAGGASGCGIGLR